jgi:hypothetical protein
MVCLSAATDVLDSDLLPPFDPVGCARYAQSYTNKGVAGLVGDLKQAATPAPAPILPLAAFHGRGR